MNFPGNVWFIQRKHRKWRTGNGDVFMKHAKQSRALIQWTGDMMGGRESEQVKKLIGLDILCFVGICCEHDN